VKDLQTYALANPVARANQTQDPKFFRRLTGGWAVGLTVNK
jgi:hypothetical protein